MTSLLEPATDADSFTEDEQQLISFLRAHSRHESQARFQVGDRLLEHFPIRNVGRPKKGSMTDWNDERREALFARVANASGYEASTLDEWRRVANRIPVSLRTKASDGNISIPWSLWKRAGYSDDRLSELSDLIDAAIEAGETNLRYDALTAPPRPTNPPKPTPASTTTTAPIESKPIVPAVDTPVPEADDADDEPDDPTTAIDVLYTSVETIQAAAEVAEAIAPDEVPEDEREALVSHLRTTIAGLTRLVERLTA